MSERDKTSEGQAPVGSANFRAIRGGWREEDSWDIQIPPLTEEEVQKGLAALEASRVLRQEILTRRAGRPLPPSWPLIRESRERVLQHPDADLLDLEPHRITEEEMKEFAQALEDLSKKAGNPTPRVGVPKISGVE